MGRLRLKCKIPSASCIFVQKRLKCKKQMTELTVLQKSAGEKDQQLCGNIVISIEKMLERLPQINAECNIYQVTKELREMNPKAYAPQLISIGPFHHGARDDLIANEQYKLQGFINFLRRMKIESLEEGLPQTRSLEDLLKTKRLKVLVEKAHGWVKEARNCYATPIKMKEEEFVIMMLVDACFIVEFFILKFDDCNPNRKFISIQDNVDLSFYQGIDVDISTDLIKLENQVPFFLLRSLFGLISKDNPSIIVSSKDCPISFRDILPSALEFGLVCKCAIDMNEEPKHLVDFLSLYFAPFPSDDMENKQDEIKNSENNNNNFLSFFWVLFPAHWQKQNGENSTKKKNNDFLSLFCSPLGHLWNKKAAKKKSEKESSNIPPSITELCEAGVIIKKAENAQYMRNITFKNGVLEIPPLYIYDNFELMLRNMVAFEQFDTRNRNKCVTQYVLFLDHLISTEKDVHLLVKAGVIVNNIGGSDKEVSDLFNNLGKFVTESRSLHFDCITEALREHCNGWWNKAKASLKHNYFNTPWAFISFIAATFLILLTILQTIFSAISTFPKQPS